MDAKDVRVVNGKIYVYNNGIMNDEKEALKNAAQQSSPEAIQQGVYVIINPHTGNPVAEVLSAAWDKINEISGAALPISNASEANIDIRNQVKEQNGAVVEVDHSRGSLTSSNATAEQINRGEAHAPIQSVTYNGAAANAQRMSNWLEQATGGQGQMFQSTHQNDLVGRIIGGNPETGGVAGSGMASHSSYTGSLPPESIGSDVNPLRTLTNQTWGVGKISEPVLVPPSNGIKSTQ